MRLACLTFISLLVHKNCRGAIPIIMWEWAAPFSWRGSKAVMHRIANPSRSVRLRPAPPINKTIKIKRLEQKCLSVLSLRVHWQHSRALGQQKSITPVKSKCTVVVALLRLETIRHRSHMLWHKSAGYGQISETSILKHKRSRSSFFHRLTSVSGRLVDQNLERETSLELATSTLARLRSTN